MSNDCNSSKCPLGMTPNELEKLQQIEVDLSEIKTHKLYMRSEISELKDTAKLTLENLQVLTELVKDNKRTAQRVEFLEDNLEWILFLSRHKVFAILIAVGLYALTIKEVRDTVIAIL